MSSSHCRSPGPAPRKSKGSPTLDAVEPNRLLDEQLAYDRARAPEYDRWFHRQGRYDRGDDANRAWFEEDDANRAWFEEVEEAARALESMPLAGAEVLELAARTGSWTERLVDRGARVTALDASPEMSELNRQRLGARSNDVTYVRHDLLEPAPGEEVMVRRLDDGRQYRIVKNFWPAGALSARFAAAGLDVAITETRTYFQYGIGRRRD